VNRGERGGGWLVSHVFPVPLIPASRLLLAQEIEARMAAERDAAAAEAAERAKELAARMEAMAGNEALLRKIKEEQVRRGGE
jgi:hypothetical protein